MTVSTIDRRQALALLAASSAALTARLSHAAAPGTEPTAQHTHVTTALAAYIAGSGTAAIPATHRELARQHILDTLASIVACRDLEPAVVARKFAIASSGSVTSNAATILGTRERCALSDAVFASAMTAHSAEINDFIPSAFVQPGPAIVSAALALAETRGRSGEAILRAVVVGYELAGRIPS